MSDTKHLDWDEQFNSGSFDEVDAVQRLRQEIGDDRDVQVTLHISAWGLDQLLAALELACRYAKGERFK